MVINIKGIFITDYYMDLVNFYGLMVLYIKANLKIIELLVKVFINGQMVAYTKVM
jgi:hypothetical protein